MFPIVLITNQVYAYVQKKAVGNVIDFHFTEEDYLNSPTFPPNNIFNNLRTKVKKRYTFSRFI